MSSLSVITAHYDFETKYVRFVSDNSELTVLRYDAPSSTWVFGFARDVEVLRYADNLSRLVLSADPPEREPFRVTHTMRFLTVVRIADTLYTWTYASRLCANCQDAWYKHAEEKCLWEPTTFITGYGASHRYFEGEALARSRPPNR